MMNQAEIKAITDDTVTVAGYGALFGGMDLDGEHFSHETDFMLELVPVKLVLYDHGLREVKHPIGRTMTVTPDEKGLWVEAELDRHTAYVDKVLTLVQKGALGWSSGSVPHLALREGKSIKRWPVVEFSLTPTPAEPRTVGVEILKSLAAVDASYHALLPEDAPASTEGATSVQEADLLMREVVAEVMAQTLEQLLEEPQPGDEEAASPNPSYEEPVSAEVTAPTLPADDEESSFLSISQVEERMDEQKPVNSAAEADVKSLSDKVDSLSTALNQVLEFMQSSPKVKSAGYFTEDGGAADKTVKSFGDFLIAVARKDTVRLGKVYKSFATKDQTEGVGVQGGYLVPPEYSQQLLALAESQSQIVARVTTVPVTTDRGFYPVLDQYITPTPGAGDTALAGGITSKVTAEGATLVETQAKFQDLEWRINKVGGYTEITNELVMDSPQAIETLFSRLFVVAIAAKNERNILRGSGAGEPLGIITSGAALGITPATDGVFKWADALAMVSRFKSAGGQPVWIIHPSIWPDLGQMETTAGGGVWQANMQGNIPSVLLSYPILVSEHLPQANNAGAALLADLSAFLFFQRGGLQIDFSEHAAFKEEKGTWRFSQRNDGKPWLRQPVTLPDPQGSYTVSPFVYHND
jgi:HK97 family phage major capsid protein